MEAAAYNPRRQGDLGEISAIEYFGMRRIPVYMPINHSPDVDLVVWYEERWAGVQVKTCGVFRNGRWEVSLATRGGNRSWSGLVKRFSCDRCDYLFVLVADGRRWLIPAAHVEGGAGLTLGGPKYRAFEIEPGRPFRAKTAA